MSRTRKRPAGRTALLAVLVGMAVPAAREMAAQGPPPATATITPVQGLAFGQLIGGIAEAVPPTNALQRAHVVVEGRGRLQLRFALPANLRAASGAVIPVAFGSSDGMIALENDPVVVFDPKTTAQIHFRGNRDVAQVYLGGVATPAVTQPAGTYTATVTVILIDPRA